jgi:hypothetical protein
MESLLSVKEDAEKGFSSIFLRSAFPRLGLAFAFTCGSTFLAVVAAGPTALVVAIGASLAACLGAAGDGDAMDNQNAALDNRINTEVGKLAAAHPEEAGKSPRFLKAMNERFNLASAGDLALLRVILPAPAVTSPAKPTP